MTTPLTRTAFAILVPITIALNLRALHSEWETGRSPTPSSSSTTRSCSRTVSWEVTLGARESLSLTYDLSVYR